MIIEVDTNILKDNKMSIKDYFFCYLIYKNQHGLLNDYMDIELEKKEYFTKLENDGWLIKASVPILHLEISDKFKNLFKKQNQDDLFKELVELFPVKVLRIEGKEQYLRTGQKEAKKLYKSIINGSKEEHEKIIQCLKTEIIYRENTDNMKYFRTLLNWLKNEEWLAYEGVEIEANSNSKTQEAYGTGFF